MGNSTKIYVVIAYETARDRDDHDMEYLLGAYYEKEEANKIKIAYEKQNNDEDYFSARLQEVIIGDIPKDIKKFIDDEERQQHIDWEKQERDDHNRHCEEEELNELRQERKRKEEQEEKEKQAKINFDNRFWEKLQYGNYKD